MTGKRHRRAMTREEVKEILDRVLTWPAEEQEKVVEIICAIEQISDEDDLTDGNGKLSNHAWRNGTWLLTNRSKPCSAAIAGHEDGRRRKRSMIGNIPGK